MNIKPGLSFDDVLLVPKYSEIDSRKHVDLSVRLGRKGKSLKLDIPIISANMKTVTGSLMAGAVSNMGGLGLLHRFWREPLTETTQEFKLACKYGNPELIGCSVGIQDSDRELVDRIVDAGCKIVCIDVAHADHQRCLLMTEWISNKYPRILLIVGTVATGHGAKRLWNNGADVVRTGVGNGSLCSTRIETGCGVPQLTALEDCYHTAKECGFSIVADGGIKQAGDAVKALVFSDAVVLGSILAGTDEAPGDIVTMNEQRYKAYAGSSTHKTSHIEGVSTFVPCKGPVSEVISKLLEGIRSGLSYQGAQNLAELKEDPLFVSITNAGLAESHPHNPYYLKSQK